VCVCVCVCVAPVVRVSSVEVVVVDSDQVKLTWNEVSCWDRQGLQPRYEILLVDAHSLAVAVNLSTNSSPPAWLYALHAYTAYTVRVRYANEHGTAPYSYPVNLTTLPARAYHLYLLIYFTNIDCDVGHMQWLNVTGGEGLTPPLPQCIAPSHK